MPLGSTFIAIGVLVFRASHSWNTLRGDESLLLSDALEDGIGATLRSFGGYLHVVQRLMIWFASLFSPGDFHCCYKFLDCKFGALGHCSAAISTKSSNVDSAAIGGVAPATWD